MTQPFDLEAAKAGAKVMTRGGRPVRIVCWDMRGGLHHIVAIIQQYGDREYAQSYKNDGSWIAIETQSDLVMA